MQIVPSLLFGISASLDALLVGISFGIRNTQIKFWQNLLISTITLLGTCLSIGLGRKFILLLPASLWNGLGSLVLILLGIYYLVKFMKNSFQKYQLTATELTFSTSEKPTSLSISEICILGCSLSANNMGIGLGASITGLPLLPSALVTLLFSALFLFLGNHFSRCNRCRLTESSANLITGCMLIALGILQFLNISF